MIPPRPLSGFQQGFLAFAIGLWGTYGLVEFAAFIFRSTAQ
jgi:hypothetical protein